MHTLATSDVFWDKIVEITSIGEHDVYDGTVSGTHNFVANLVSLHNILSRIATSSSCCTALMRSSATIRVAARPT